MKIVFFIYKVWLSAARVVHNFFSKKIANSQAFLQTPLYTKYEGLTLKNKKMETSVVSFEQIPELVQNLVEMIESLEKIAREKHQLQPLEGVLMSVEDVCKLLGKSKSAVCRTVRYHDIPFIRQGNRLNFDRVTIKKRLGKKHNVECIIHMSAF